jgi:hypothetical protein
MVDLLVEFVFGIIDAVRPGQPRGRRALVIVGVLLIGLALLVALAGVVFLALS